MYRFGTFIAAMTLVGGLVVSTVASVDAAPEPPPEVGASALAVTGPEPTTYTSFRDDVYDRLAYSGDHVAVLVPDNGYDDDVMARIVTVMDAAYEFYAESTGREPTLYFNYNGLATIAVVDSTCGAGCGFLGATGIEMLQSYVIGTDVFGFDTFYNGVADNDQFGQVPFYELGRNFWFYGGQLNHNTDEPGVSRGSITTGYAVFMRFLAMDATGVDPGPFRGRPLSEFRQTVIDMLAPYLADEEANWENTLKVQPDADFMASFLFDLQRRFGDDFIGRFWKEVGMRPNRVTTQDALDNFVIAASYAANRNLADFFEFEWKWPVSAAARQEIADHDFTAVAHLIAGNATPPRADRPIRDLLIEEGFEVSIVDDDGDLAALAPVDGDIVVISSSVVPSKVGDTLADVAAPVLTWEGYLFDDMAMSASGETRRTFRSLSIVDPLHPLAAGASGYARVYNQAHKLAYGMPGPDADVVASVPGRPGQATAFAYDRGDTLVDGTAAPGRRVGLFPDYAGAGDLTEQGMEMVRAAVRWVQSGPPANDDFAERFAVGAGEYGGTVENASLEPGEPTPSAASEDVGSSVWWSWTAPSDGLASVDTSGSGIDTVLSVWIGDQLASLSEVASNDDGIDTSASSVLFEAEAGIEYQIAVYRSRFDDSRETNDLTLTIAHYPPPVNDDFADRLTVTQGDHVGILSGATIEPGEQQPLNVSASSASAWWSWTAPADGHARVIPTGTGFFFTGSGVWTGDDVGGLTEVDSAADGEVVDFEVEAGETYHLAFYARLHRDGDVEFTIDFISPPPNDDFADRISIGIGSHTGSNVDATIEDGEVLPQAGSPRASVWWTWTAPRTGTVEVDTFGSDFDTVLAAWDGENLSILTEIASNDDIEGSLQSLVGFTVEAGQTVQLGVYGYGDDRGAVQLNVRYDERRAVFVAGSDRLLRTDRDIRDLIEDEGFVVDIVDDDSDLTALDLSRVELLVVSSSVNILKVDDVFADVDVPVLVWEGYLFDEFGLARRGRETMRLHTNVVVNDDHPASGGLDGPVAVYQSDHRLSTATVAAGAQVIAHEPGRPRSAVMFAYETGALRYDGTPTPARRIGLFPDYLGAGDLTTPGNLLVTSAIDWLTETG